MTEATTIELPVRSTDLDADRIVNNALYFIYFEQARLAHLRQLAILGRSRRSEPARSFTIAATEARFLAPTVFPEVLRVSAWTKEVRNRSFVFGYAAERAGDGVRVAEGSSAQVWLDETGRPAILPDAVRLALLASLLPAASS